MIYVALLRGINVGGNNKVPMAELKTLFEQLGFTGVVTYINSGNVIFWSELKTDVEIIEKIESGIEEIFGFSVSVIVRNFDEIRATIAAIPSGYTNNAKQKTDVMFLWPGVDSPKVLDSIVVKSEIEIVRYVPGAIVWNIMREHVTKSAMLKIISTPLYKQMTVRNINTVRKLELLMIAATQ